MTAYIRSRNDTTRSEPRRLYNLTEFMICDKDGGGTMSEDECSEILYTRFGRSALANEQTKDLFQKAGAKADNLTYQQFLKILEHFESDRNDPYESQQFPKNKKSAKNIRR